MPVTPLPEDDFRSVLASVDKHGKRRHLYVLRVGGFWRRWRSALAVVLIGFYMALPFIQVNGLPFFRIDIPHRQFICAGQVFWPQDVYYLLLFALIAVVLTMLMVAVVGRFFCGWLCPHHIFLEMIYRPIEQLICGTPARQIANKKAHKGGLQRAITWAIFALISGALANTATALFIGTEGFYAGFIVNPFAHPTAALFFIIFFTLILFNFGWLREQTCTILCPYGRLQSVMLDKHSLTVAYDAARGEPRGKVGHTTGDCVDCERCVRVCPTGIDIRNGIQLECINCTACIDACATVMTQLGRAPTLIRYASEISLAGGKRRLFRPRSILYALTATALICFTFYHVSHRQAIVVSRLRTSAQPVMMDHDGHALIRQMVPLALVNHSREEQRCVLSLPNELGATIIQSPSPYILAADKRTEVVPVIDVPPDRFIHQRLETIMTITSTAGLRVELPITLHAP